jgi:O-antigen/teichoic acid export membrane protein
MAEGHPGDHHPSIRDAAPISARRILGRFAHLLSAEGVEGALSTLFFLYLAWLDTTFYGEVMYALAAGAIAAKVVQFGLYYPLVTRLAQVSRENAQELLGRVNLIKFALLVPTLAFVGGVALYRDFSPRMAAILLLVCLGFGLDALAETFFADLRVQGKQRAEARIKMCSAALSYGYGFLSAFLGLPAVAVGLFKLISGLTRLLLGMRGSRGRLQEGRFLDLRLGRGVGRVLRTASAFALIEILGVLYNKTNIFFLERFVGIQGVAVYSATWNLVDPISILASEHLLGWVIFPLLASLWRTRPQEAQRLVRSTGRWLFAISLPIIFLLHVESDLLIGLLYPADYKDAAWMQHYLVWTILLSFENNLFAYVMMVHGATRMLLAFAAGTTVLNLLFNLILVQSLGLTGGCLVIVLTKLAMTTMTFGYCQRHFRFFQGGDLVLPLALGTVCLILFLAAKEFWAVQPSVALCVGLYCLAIWTWRRRLMSRETPNPAAAPDPGPL